MWPPVGGTVQAVHINHIISETMVYQLQHYHCCYSAQPKVEKYHLYKEWQQKSERMQTFSPCHPSCLTQHRLSASVSGSALHLDIVRVSTNTETCISLSFFFTSELYCQFTCSRRRIPHLNSCVVFKEEEDHALVDAVQPVVQLVIHSRW